MITMTTTSTLRVGDHTMRPGSLPRGAHAAAQLFLRYRFGAAIRDHMARFLAGHLIDRLRLVMLQGTAPGASVQLHPLTIGAKTAKGAARSSTPLFETGKLAHTIYQRMAGTGKALVTFRGNASKNPGVNSGTPAGVVAHAMEYGTSFDVTEKMHAFFRHAVRNDGWPKGFAKIGLGTRLNVPARPFFVPTVAAYTPTLGKLAGDELLRIMTTATPTSVQLKP